MSKRYYWLKLKEDFFADRSIKKLRSMDRGDALVIVYLKLLLAALSGGGKLAYTGLEEDPASEFALVIDERPEDVAAAMAFLSKRALMCATNPEEYELSGLSGLVGSESESAERVRRLREQRGALHCNGDVTGCNAEKEIDKEKDKEKDTDTTPTPPPEDGSRPAGGGGGGNRHGLSEGDGETGEPRPDEGGSHDADGLSEEMRSYVRDISAMAEHPAAYAAAILARVRREGLKTPEDLRRSDRTFRSRASPGAGKINPALDYMQRDSSEYENCDFFIDLEAWAEAERSKAEPRCDRQYMTAGQAVGSVKSEV